MRIADHIASVIRLLCFSIIHIKKQIVYEIIFYYPLHSVQSAALLPTDRHSLRYMAV